MNLQLLLGDDHAIVRQGVRKILEAEPGWVLTGEAADGREAVRLAVELKPHVAVLDISMPQLSGVEATRQIARRAPAVGVVILSMHADEAYVTPAVQAGARGYVLKDAADTELIQGVAAVAAGKSFFSPSGRKSRSTTTCVGWRRRASSTATSRCLNVSGKSFS